jgi:hypothetical protein
LEDGPGQSSVIGELLGPAGINIDFHYVATNTRAVIAVDDMEKARAAI